jgi:hypothetical protein
LKILLTSGYSEQFLARRQQFDKDIPLLSKPYRREGLAKALRAALKDTRPGDVNSCASREKIDAES